MSDAKQDQDRGGEPRGPSSDGTSRGVHPRGLSGEPRVSCRRFVLHLCAFLVLLAIWTWKLLEPSPVPEAVIRGLSGDLKFVLAKLLHLGGYAFLTVLAATLPVPRRWRYVLVGLLVWHGVATEIGQTFVPNRTGKAADVLIDWAGVTAGVLVARRAFRRDRPH